MFEYPVAGFIIAEADFHNPRYPQNNVDQLRGYMPKMRIYFFKSASDMEYSSSEV